MPPTIESLSDRLSPGLADLCARGRLEPAARDAVLLRAARIDRADRLADADGRERPLLVGIVGPNNAGKSSLFTALSGTDHSPAHALGGYTSELRAVAAPERRDAAAHLLEPPRELAVDVVWSDSPTVPDHLVLVDSPDFDSTSTSNRAAAAWMLRAADLLVVVVTKNTYANAAVRSWIEEASALGRPWILVHNESPDLETARAQVEEMLGGVDHRPRSVWSAPHDLAVASGDRPLAPVRIDGRGGGDAEGPVLTIQTLVEASEATEIVRAARAADLRGLREDLEELLARTGHDAERSRALLGRLEDACTRFADALAGAGMPLQPLLRAFRARLDAADTMHGRWRSSVEYVPKMVQGLWGFAARQVAGALGREPRDHGGSAGSTPRGLSAPEAAALDHLLPTLTSALDGVADAAEAAGLDTSSQRTPSERAAAVRAALDSLPQPLADHQAACEELVGKALAARGRNDDLQWLASTLSTAPLVGSGALFVATGGLGLTDALGAAVLGAGKPMVDALLDRFGRSLLQDVRAAWIAERGQQLRRAVLGSVLVGIRTSADAHMQWQDQHGAVLRGVLDDVHGRLRG